LNAHHNTHHNHNKHHNNHQHHNAKLKHYKLKKQLPNSSNVNQNKNELNSLDNLQRDYISTTIGRDVQIDCKMKRLNNDDDKIIWLKMPKGEVLTLNGNRVTSDSRISTKCLGNLNPCWSLIITNTRESDTGFYVCQTNAMQTKYVYLDIMGWFVFFLLRNFSNLVFSSVCFFYFQVPPKLLTQYPVDRIDVNQTMNASITCEFYGKPEPLIKWYKYHNNQPKEIGKLKKHIFLILTFFS
jgi:hypothetical protein